MKRMFLLLFICLQITTVHATIPSEKQFSNSLGMKFVRIESGTFEMGQLKTPLPTELLPEYRGRGLFDTLTNGDFDEKPVHSVTITKSFYVGMYEVTNFQYELFDPEHKKLRGWHGFSKEDDEAVIFVSWYQAKAFCDWLSDKEGMTYRLPTEAEFEYACRAGTTTNYWIGDVPPTQFAKNATAMPMTVGKNKPNPWGIHDMHGNVEEWCYDFYGPYTKQHQTDPVGYAHGDFRVTRGGSHSTDIYYLRSANRMAAMPADRQWLIGFRVVLGDLPLTKPLPVLKPPVNQRNVIQRDRSKVIKGPDPDRPYFKGPLQYVKIPNGTNGPLYAVHNHDPGIVACPNGDLLAVWYSCVDEKGREMSQAASRLVHGSDQWQPASLFWDAPERNDHAPAMWFDGKDKIYHFTGMSFGAGHHHTAIIARTSDDSGKTWSGARIIIPDYYVGKKPSGPVFRMTDGSIALAVDHSGSWGNGSDLWISPDETLTWYNPGGHISGIHTGATQLDNDTIIAFGREGEFPTEKGKRAITSLPMSISTDGGKTYKWSETNFPGIGGQQRCVLLKLKQGPLFMASFANTGIEITDITGKKRKVRGLYAALSKDNGKTWPNIRLVSHDGPPQIVQGTDGGLFILSQRNSEYRGYMATCQGLDGTVHLISSRQHYAFNLKWLETPAADETSEPFEVKPITETFNGPKDFDDPGWIPYRSYDASFNGKGQHTIDSKCHHNGINHIVGKGSFEITLDVPRLQYYPRTDRVSEGFTIWIKDDRAKVLSLSIKEDHIKLEIRDTEPPDPPMQGSRYRGDRGWILENAQARYDTAPTSAKLRFIYTQNNSRWRIYYTFDPDSQASIELPQSKTGLYYGKPFTESTAIGILMSNGQADLDNFKIKPLNN
ncbi:MAG: SUMF1/EgtB/PvdO family nonheme iron enzyme [Planctomycetota bacterium]|jgi:formylglycine-generating enzyme required for sulfatase activity